MANIGWNIVDCKGHNFEDGELKVEGLYNRIRTKHSKVVAITNFKINATTACTALPVVMSFNPAAKEAITGYSGSTHENVVVVSVSAEDMLNVTLVPWA